MKKRITAIPGSLMLIPMAISALVCTYYPFLSRLKSPASDIVGSSGTMTMIGLLLFFSGADSRPDILIKSVKRGGMLALLKMVTAFIGTVIFVKCFGIKGVMGVSAVAVAACLSSMSPGVYIALMNEKGDDVDKAGYAFISLVSLPFIPVCFLTVSEGSGIDWIAMISTGLPFLLGMGLALLKKDVQQFLKRGTMILMPFLGWSLGSRVNIKTAFEAGGAGIILGIAVTLITLLPMLLAECAGMKRNGYASVGIACAGGVSVSVPAILASEHIEYLPYVETATAQIAMVVLLSTFMTPVFVKILDSKKA